MAYGVNKVHLVQAQGGKLAALPPGQIITNTLLGHQPFDPYATPDNKGAVEKAKALLQEAGLPEGVRLFWYIEPITSSVRLPLF